MPTCPCGAPAPHPGDRLSCVACGAPGCRVCAVHLESVVYCRPCAGALLETPAVRTTDPFTLY